MGYFFFCLCKRLHCPCGYDILQIACDFAISPAAKYLNEVHVYVTGNLCNQALHVMTEHFSHFAKCLNSLAISRNA